MIDNRIVLISLIIVFALLLYDIRRRYKKEKGGNDGNKCIS